MAIPAIAGLVAKAATGSRAMKAGDLAWNARRRYARQAERYAKQAKGASGIEKSRLENLASSALEKALQTYEDPSKAKSSMITNLAKELDVRIPTRKPSEKRRSKAIEESEELALESSLSDDETRRELEAQSILSSDIGNRIYGALVDIWKDSDYADRNQAIMDYFGAENMADVLQAIEDAGIDLYVDPESMERYQEIRTAISERFV